MDLGKLLPELNIAPEAIAINIIGFLLLLYIANIMVFKPINQVVEERQQDVRITYDKLEAEQRQMQELKTVYEQRLTSIEAEAREKIQSAIKEAQSIRDQIVSEANTRSRDMITRAEQEVEREKQQAMVAIREQVVDLAMGATHKIIGDGLDDARQRKLIADFISTQGGSVTPASVATKTAEA